MLPLIDELNALDEAAFATALEPLFEQRPRLVERLAGERPFASYDELFERAVALALDMPEDEQVELIDSHPRIGAAPASVSALSFREQGYNRDLGTAELQTRLDRLNDDYERRFGFRFVVWVAGRPRSEIAEMMADRLGAERGHEKERALRDVIAIARDRHARLTASKE